MSSVRVSCRGGIANVTLARPARMNAIDGALANELRAAMEELDADAAIRGAVVRGEGRAFCTGADLDALGAVLSDRAAMAELIGAIAAAFDAIERARFPVVAAVHGYALAGGLELLLACDLVVAARDARIGDQHVTYALIPGAGGTQRLPRRVGPLRAAELMLTGRWLSAEEAAAWGLVNQVVDREQLDAAADALASQLASKSPAALGHLKRLGRRAQEVGAATGKAEEMEAFLAHVGDPDVARGLRAFFERKERG